MKILVLGANGYTGEPIAKHLSRSHEVIAVDSYYKRDLLNKLNIDSIGGYLMMPLAFHDYQIPVEAFDITKKGVFDYLIEKYDPDTIIHLAQQPSAPYSMRGEDEAFDTMFNNLGANLRLIYAVLKHNPDIHIIKLGTMGEYGTPNTEIPEGWFDCNYKGRSDRMLFPKKPHSIYHLSKVHDSDALAFAARVWGLRVTDLNQGIVYGNYDNNRFCYDDMFGTALNRFIAQSVANVPLTVYGTGGQHRGWLNILDTLQCIQLAVENPAKTGEFRVLNQFTEQFTVLELANLVSRVTGANISHINNPRHEEEDHFYKAEHTALKELGLDPHLLTEEVIEEMVTEIKDAEINVDQILPKVRWNNASHG